jgi:hypothetical protein
VTLACCLYLRGHDTEDNSIVWNIPLGKVFAKAELPPCCVFVLNASTKLGGGSLDLSHSIMMQFHWNATPCTHSWNATRRSDQELGSSETTVMVYQIVITLQSGGSTSRLPSAGQATHPSSLISLLEITRPLTPNPVAHFNCRSRAFVVISPGGFSGAMRPYTTPERTGPHIPFQISRKMVGST